MQKTEQQRIDEGEAVFRTYRGNLSTLVDLVNCGMDMNDERAKYMIPWAFGAALDKNHKKNWNDELPRGCVTFGYDENPKGTYKTQAQADAILVKMIKLYAAAGGNVEHFASDALRNSIFDYEQQETEAYKTLQQLAKKEILVPTLESLEKEGIPGIDPKRRAEIIEKEHLLKKHAEFENTGIVLDENALRFSDLAPPTKSVKDGKIAERIIPINTQIT